MAAPIVPGFANVLIDAKEFSAAIFAFEPGQIDVEWAVEIEKAMDQVGEIVQRAVRKRAKRHYRTGSLERNVKVMAIGAGWNRTVRVHSGGHHAHLVAGRVRPHRIPRLPRRPRHPHGSDMTPAMPLYVQGGIVGFSQSVEHPGSRGDPYFHVGAMNSRLAINAVLKASARRLTTHLAVLVAQSADRAATGPVP